MPNITFTCEECKALASGRADYVLSGRKRYCSVSCANSARAKAKHQKTPQTGINKPNYKWGRALTPYQHKLRQIERNPEKSKS